MPEHPNQRRTSRELPPDWSDRWAWWDDSRVIVEAVTNPALIKVTDFILQQGETAYVQLAVDPNTGGGEALDLIVIGKMDSPSIESDIVNSQSGKQVLAVPGIAPGTADGGAVGYPTHGYDRYAVYVRINVAGHTAQPKGVVSVRVHGCECKKRAVGSSGGGGGGGGFAIDRPPFGGH